MPFQNILIDTGEEIAISPAMEGSTDYKIRNQTIEGFRKFDFTAQQADKIIPNPSLFFDVGDKLHGSSPVTPMRIKLEELFSPMNKKLFTVVNRNTAHQMSFFLADFAFRHFGNPARKKVVINIDQHLDYGTGTSSAKFLSWGGNVITNTADGLCYNIATPSTYTDVTYVVAGIFPLDSSAVKKEDYEFKYISSKMIQRKGTVTSTGKQKNLPINMKFKDFNAHKAEIYSEIIEFFINEIFGEKIKGGTVPQNLSNTDYYITLDTDAMWGSNTCYPSGTLDSNAVLTLINNIFDKITEYGDFLAGFDITGLPINDNPERNPFDFPSYNNSYTQIEKLIDKIKFLIQDFFPDY